MIQVTANETNDLHDKGEVVTKLNKRGEKVLRNALVARANKLRRTYNNSEKRPQMYEDTINLYVSLFGRRPSGH